MSDNIAGYIDRNYIKGQFYKLAGCPKPVIAGSTTNINEISDEILSKAVYAVVGQTAGGDFPNNAIGSTFLVNTVEYGNSVYLQTATSVEAGREYTYSRIYSGGAWSTWLSADSKANEAKEKADAVETMITDETNGIQAQISNITDANTENTIAWKANKALTDAGNAANNAQSGINAMNMLAPLGNKIAIISDFFSGSIGAYGTKDKSLNIRNLNFNSIKAVIPFCNNPGSGAAALLITVTSRDVATIQYKLYRPADSSSSYSNYRISFLIFGNG